MGWRERAIEKMEQAAGEWGVPFSAPDREDMAAAMLDALLAPETIPCPDCGGVGKDRYWAEGDTLAMKACPSCDGSGVVDGEPLLIERDRLERAEYVAVERMAQDGRAQFPAGYTAMTRRAAEPLYRLRDVNEGEGQ